MDKVGLKPETYKSGKFKDMLSGERNEDEIPAEERAMVQSLIDETYGKFKNVVAEGRKQAPILYAALQDAVGFVKGGERSVPTIVTAARKRISSSPLAEIDYVEVINSETLQPVKMIQPNSRMALAVFFGQARLIDNIRLL